MIPILFNPTDGITNGFTTNGIGRLSDATRCEVTEALNDMYELEMDYPMSGAHFGDIKNGNIIGAVPFQNGTLQGFEIYKVTKPIDGNVSVYARHVSYRLTYTPVNRFSADNSKNAFVVLKNGALENCPFTFDTEIDINESFSSSMPRSIRSALLAEADSIISVYGGDFEFDNYKVHHKKKRGSNKGAVIRYGKNLTDLTQEQNIEETITGIFPYWESNEAYISLTKPLQSTYADSFPYHRSEVVDASGDFDNEPTVAELTAWGNKYIEDNKVGIPVVSITISFVDLKDTYEYKELTSVPSINLGDTVTVIFEKLGINETSMVNKTVWDVLNDCYVSIDIGEPKTNYSNTIFDTVETADAAVTNGTMEDFVNKATGKLKTGQQGHMVINRNKEGWANELIFADNENIYRAKNLVRFNSAGIGFSTTGYDGPYRNAWTIDGNLSADFIRSGSLIIGGKAYNKSGKIQIYDANNEVLVEMGQSGVTINKGKLKAANIEGGTIRIGEGFRVDNKGTMTAVNGKFTGDISGGTIRIGNNFKVDKDGKMTATSAMFKGDIEGSKITGSSIICKGGQFEASEDEVYIGGFYTYSTGAGDYLGSEDGEMGIGTNKDYNFWTGWDGTDPNIHDPYSILQHYGTVITDQNMYAQEIYLNDGIFLGKSGRWWGVGETIADIYDRLDDLESQIDSGGDE